MKLALTDLHLPLRHPFTITHGTTTVKHNLLVTLSDGTHTGCGEGAGSFAYRAFTAESMRADLEKARSLIEGTPLETPESFWQTMLPALGHNRFALCALDQAAHDLWGKRLGQPVWQLWGLNVDHFPPSSYTIGIDTIDTMTAKLREFPGWPVYKIKLGTAQDVEIVRALRQHTDAVFRVDANTAWTPEQTIASAPELRELGVEFIEQPLAAGDWTGMKRIMAECALPVIADESCLTEEDVEKCAGHFHGINIKLSKAGGLTPARRMVAKARALGLRVMTGCMCESTVGISAAAMLLPLLDYADMDGAALLAGDVADGVRMENGRARFPAVPGTGVTLWPERDFGRPARSARCDTGIHP
jgi:L-Ala-D/L-Glu epimerase